MTDPFRLACEIIEQHTRIEIAKKELEEAQQLVKEKQDNLYNHKARLWELENGSQWSNAYINTWFSNYS